MNKKQKRFKNMLMICSKFRALEKLFIIWKMNVQIFHRNFCQQKTRKCGSKRKILILWKSI